MSYGVVPTGFSKKPLAVILAEIEASLVTEFGPNVIQTPQSPLGQINGLMADLIAELWEFGEDVYQSYDPDQAEGVRLDTLARLRLIHRASDDDADFRQAITNAGAARIDIQDITRAVRNVAGVTYAKVFVNDTDETDINGIPPHSIAVAVIGGADDEIGQAIRQNITPGISTYGNYSVETVIDGYCRSFRIVRPLEIEVTLIVQVRVSLDTMGCPPPSPTAILNTLVEQWNLTRENGKDVTPFTVRSIIESNFSNVEVVDLVGERPGEAPGPEEEVLPTVDIAFLEIADLANVSIEVVE